MYLGPKHFSFFCFAITLLSISWCCSKLNSTDFSCMWTKCGKIVYTERETYCSENGGCVKCNSSQSRITIWQTLWPVKPFSSLFFLLQPLRSSTFPYVVFNRFLLFVFLFEDQKAYLCKMKKCFYLLLTPPLSLHYGLKVFKECNSEKP